MTVITRLRSGCLFAAVVIGLIIVVGLGSVLVHVVGCGPTKGGGGFVAGDHVSVTDKMWCMESKDALSDLQRAADSEEMQRVFIEKGITILSPGQQVKVLELSFTSAKVRTPGNQECWVVSNVLQGTR